MNVFVLTRWLIPDEWKRFFDTGKFADIKLKLLGLIEHAASFSAIIIFAFLVGFLWRDVERVKSFLLPFSLQKEK